MRRAVSLLALLVTFLMPAQASAGGHFHATRHTWGPWQRYWITGYCYGQLTATGTPARWGEVAVDPSVIRLGSTLEIRGLGVFHAEDTGGAVVGRHVDVFTSCAHAYEITGWWSVRVRR